MVSFSSDVFPESLRLLKWMEMRISCLAPTVAFLKATASSTYFKRAVVFHPWQTAQIYLTFNLTSHLHSLSDICEYIHLTYCAFYLRCFHILSDMFVHSLIGIHSDILSEIHLDTLPSDMLPLNLRFKLTNTRKSI